LFGKLEHGGRVKLMMRAGELAFETTPESADQAD